MENSESDFNGIEIVFHLKKIKNNELNIRKEWEVGKRIDIKEYYKY